jgi:hypothetical protein
MDDPTLGPSASVRLQRTCEHSRLEKQFLMDAYEHLVAIVEDDALRRGADDEGRSMAEDRSAKRRLIHTRAACPGGSS